MPHVHVTFLGTGAGQCVYRAHTAIVLDWDDGTRVLLDASSGNSALRHGAQLGMSAQDFNQVLLTHIDSQYHINPQPLVDEARRSFSGPVSVACDLYRIGVTGG